MKQIIHYGVISLLLCTAFPATAEPNITNAWIRLLPPMVKTTAAYMDIKSDQNDTLLSVTSILAERVEIHESSMEKGMMSMKHISQVKIPKNTLVRLSPQGKHLMLIGLKQPLKQNSTYSFTLNFEQAGQIEVLMPVKNP